MPLFSLLKHFELLQFEMFYINKAALPFVNISLQLRENLRNKHGEVKQNEL